MKRSIAVVAIVLVFAASFAGAASASASPSKANVSTVVDSAGKKNPVYAIDPAGTCSVQGDLEGKFKASQMRQYLQCIVPMVDAWIDVVYKAMPHPQAYIYVPKGSKGTPAGGQSCGTVDKNSYEFCSADNTVFVGWKMVWTMYSQDGDASSAYAIAHEVTHHFQYEAGVFDYVAKTYGSRAQNPNAYIGTENQADCGGGAFLNYLDKQGDLNVRDDLQDISATLAFVASAESQGKMRDHGTDQERVASFNLGFQSTAVEPMTACNAFYPSYPLIS